MSDKDSHNYCSSCRDKGKGNDICVKENPEDCYRCLQFWSDQIKKLNARKVERKAKEGSISKELVDFCWELILMLLRLQCLMFRPLPL